MRPLTTEEGFQSNISGVHCTVVRPPTEPDLMGWDPGSRANLSSQRSHGVVVVHYEATGCDVELQVLSNCSAPGKYEYEPYFAADHVVAHNANELFGKLPLGAARLSAQMQGNRALRTDYQMVGVATIADENGAPLGPASVHRKDLQGQCEGATHVVSKVFLGGFSMTAGESDKLDAEGSFLFTGSVGASSSADVQRMQEEGLMDDCAAATRDKQENRGCAVPLRIALLPLDLPTCAPGKHLRGAECVADRDVCSDGQHFEPGHGCVNNGLSKWVFFTTAGGAAAAIAAGSVIAVQAQQQQDQQLKLDVFARDPNVRTSIQQESTVANILFVGGGALGVGAVALAAMTQWKSTEAPSHRGETIVPWVTTGSAGVTASGDF